MTASTNPETAALTLDDVVRRFGPKSSPALDHVSFTVPAGSLTVILGPAGAGKTTTLRIIAGLDGPDHGAVRLAGRDTKGMGPKDRDVAMIFDNLALYPDKTGFQNIANPLLVRKTTPAEIKDQVERLADILQVAHVLHRLPKTMSGGERQRIALGRALIRTPSLFLLDEPLSSLDAKLRIELRAELKRLQREHGYTFLLATPDFNEALAIADQVVMLQHGRVVQIAPPQTLYDLPVDREVARFVGAPQINLVPARFIVEENGSHIEAAGLHIPVPDHLTEILAPGQTFELGTRPENLQLAPPGQASVGPRTSAKLVDVESLGLKSVLTVEADGQELRLMAESVQTKDLAQGHVVEIEAVETRRLLAFDQETGQRLTSPADSEP